MMICKSRLKCLLRQEREKEPSEEPLRTEDIRLLTGKGHFVGDFSAQNQAFMGLVHSPCAHGAEVILQP
jgi:CO/xanthine dehydrogenase Mo-binding subunit